MCKHWHDYAETGTGGIGEYCRAAHRSTLCMAEPGRCECGLFEKEVKNNVSSNVEGSRRQAEIECADF